LNKYGFFKLCRFCHKIGFALKIYHNFKSYQNMLTILGFFFLCHKLQLCFICQAHYTPFTCGTVFLIWKILWISKFSNSITFKLWVFWMWVVGYYHIKFFYIKSILLRKSFTWSFTKLITYAQLWLKFKCFFIKTKIQI